MSIDERGVADGAPGHRALWKAVAVPSEHGGWGLTMEPALLGLLLAPSLGGVAIGLAAFVAFLVRSPLKLFAVDVRRHRRLARTKLALRFVAVELALLATLALVATWRGGWSWLVPIAAVAPLVAIELWFDVRSRGRRLIPEICGAVGISAVAAAIVLAGGKEPELAAGAAMILAGRAAGSIPFVRAQIDRLRHGPGRLTTSDRAQVVGAGIAALAVIVDDRVLLGAVGVAALATSQLVWVRRPPVAAKVLGVRQMVLGLVVVMMTAAGAAW